MKIFRVASCIAMLAMKAFRPVLAEESSILENAYVVPTDITSNFNIDPDALIKLSYKSFVETTDTDFGGQKEFMIDLGQSFNVVTVFL